jgi:hypothetical protein
LTCPDFSFNFLLKDRLRGEMSRDATGCHGFSVEIGGQRGCYSSRHITVFELFNQFAKNIELVIMMSITNPNYYNANTH